jgi:hypothetical protein
MKWEGGIQEVTSEGRSAQRGDIFSQDEKQRNYQNIWYLGWVFLFLVIQKLEI